MVGKEGSKQALKRSDGVWLLPKQISALNDGKSVNN